MNIYLYEIAGQVIPDLFSSSDKALDHAEMQFGLDFSRSRTALKRQLSRKDIVHLYNLDAYKPLATIRRVKVK